MHDPIAPILKRQSTLILDGGLATELEQRGHDIDHPLWSAKILLEAPQAIQQLHEEYLRVGADCLITASYQATLPGLMALGLSRPAAIDTLRLATQLGRRARDHFWATAEQHNRQRPLVAASVGPYGAYLADGSEYTGQYDLDQAGLRDFHRPRWHLLAADQPDLLACETIPTFAEARALVDLLAETPHLPAWFSFTCGDDGRHLPDGTPLAECAAYLDSVAQVVAIGVNCVPPRLVSRLVTEIQTATHKPIVVYPNSGERYDPTTKSWLGESMPEAFGTVGHLWRQQGAVLIGGCCRTRPAHIRALSTRLKQFGKPYYSGGGE